MMKAALTVTGNVREVFSRLDRKLLVLYTSAVSFLLTAPSPALAAGELTEFFSKVGHTVKYMALVVGWGLGFFFVVSGILDLMRKSDDPRAGGKGVAKLAGGVGLITAATVIYWIMNHFGLATDQSIMPPSPSGGI